MVALVPDAHWVYSPLHAVTKPVVHDSVASNVFWLHGLVDASVLDAYDTRARPWMSVPLVVAYLAFRANLNRREGVGP